MKVPISLAFLLPFGTMGRQANIIVMPWDDFGWNDMGRFSTDYGPTDSWGGATPHTDSLAREGITLSRHYVDQRCTPTRAQLLTGRYSLRYGLGITGIGGDARSYGLYANDGLARTETTMASELRAANFSTYFVGKWHLGFARYDYFPNARGFDSSYGFYVKGEVGGRASGRAGGHAGRRGGGPVAVHASTRL